MESGSILFIYIAWKSNKLKDYNDEKVVGIELMMTIQVYDEL